jgi:hypothetical protein
MIWGARVDITALLSTLIVNPYCEHLFIYYLLFIFIYFIGNLTLLILYGYSS